MVLTAELIEAVKKEVDLQKYFIKADTATATDLLFKQFIENTKWKGMSKIIFYILMDELYPVGKDSFGDLGYKVTLKPFINE